MDDADGYGVGGVGLSGGSGTCGGWVRPRMLDPDMSNCFAVGSMGAWVC
jgi:hypothetical protein